MAPEHGDLAWASPSQSPQGWLGATALPSSWGMSQGPAQPHSRLLVSIPHCPTLFPLCRCRFIQGSATRNPYVFYHWRYIDIFIYFSHHTVTIPPVCWTNAAHRNGVPVLGEGKAGCKGSPRRTLGLPGRMADAGLTTSPGTFITEWTDGEKLCEAFLAGGEEAYHAVSEQLARIAQHYRFDGWLVNVENTLSVSRGCALPASPPALTLLPHGGPRPMPTCACFLLPGSSGEEPAPFPAALDGAGAQRCARGTGDLVRQRPAEWRAEMAERAERGE